jgi:hypothetical protein
MMKKLFLVISIMILLSGCTMLERFGKNKINKVRQDLSEFEEIKLVKGDIAIYKVFKSDKYYVQRTGESAIQITERDVLDYIIWGDKITDIPKKLEVME